GRTRATLLNIKFGISEKDMPFNYRKWNILAFRGRLMSLLVLTHYGVSPRPHLRQESCIIHLLGQIIIIVYVVFFYLGQFHNHFYLFIIRRTGPLIGAEGGDSYGNSMSLETPQRAKRTRRLKPCPWKASACSGNQQF